jgi:hypothetical protein
MSDILRAGLWAQRAQALAGLGRMSESQESIGFAVRLASGARELLSGRWRPRRLLFIVATIGVSQTYWRIGMACLAMGKLDDARDSFSIGSDADAKRKYGARCRQQLAQMGVPVG